MSKFFKKPDLPNEKIKECVEYAINKNRVELMKDILKGESVYYVDETELMDEYNEPAFLRNLSDRGWTNEAEALETVKLHLLCPYLSNIPFIPMKDNMLTPNMQPERLTRIMKIRPQINEDTLQEISDIYYNLPGVLKAVFAFQCGCWVVLGEQVWELNKSKEDKSAYILVYPADDLERTLEDKNTSLISEAIKEVNEQPYNSTENSDGLSRVFMDALKSKDIQFDEPEVIKAMRFKWRYANGSYCAPTVPQSINYLSEINADFEDWVNAPKAREAGEAREVI